MQNTRSNSLDYNSDAGASNATSGYNSGSNSDLENAARRILVARGGTHGIKKKQQQRKILCRFFLLIFTAKKCLIFTSSTAATQK